MPSARYFALSTSPTLLRSSYVENRKPSALDDFLFDLNGYLILKNARRPPAGCRFERGI